MSDKSKKWKDFLLKSGVPLEYEVKQLLDKHGCISNYEFTYLRPDENEIINEFSYDINASYIYGGHLFELMVECKYRDQSTNWIFTPENYQGIDEIEHYSFLNPNDHFTQKNKFSRLDYEPYGPLCGKGIEINSDAQNPKTISQAIHQLSYAMAEKVVSGMEHQIEELLSSSEVIFYAVPIIVTTANLYRLKNDITIQEIKTSNEISEISTKEDCLILKTPTGKHLENYNFQHFAQFIEKYGQERLNQKLKSFNKDINFVFSVIAQHYCPSCIAIIQFTESNIGFQKLFAFLDEVILPTEKTIKREKEKQRKMTELSKQFKELGKVTKPASKN